MRRIPLSIEIRKLLRLLTVTILGILFLSAVYFFIKTSNTAELGYTLRENQLLQKTLEAENRILKQKLLDAQSLSILKKSKVVKEMVEPESKIFVPKPMPLTRRNVKTYPAP